MTAFVSIDRISDSIEVQKLALALVGQQSVFRNDDARGGLRVARALASVVDWIGQVLERRRWAEIARRNGPVNLDDAWAGGWYARSQMLQEALLQRGCATSAKPAPSRIDWDDKLD